MSEAAAKINSLLNTLGEDSDEKCGSVEHKYRLDYFAVPGRAGPIRLAFYLQDIPFEDKFVAFPELKALQSNKQLPWMGLPQLFIYDQKTDEQLHHIGQSNSILRYVARLKSSKLYPIYDNFKCLIIDEICDACEDLSNSFGITMRIKDEKEKELKRKEFWKDRWSVLFE